MIRFTAEQSANLPFPTGSPVWYNFKASKDDAGRGAGLLMKRGVVKSAFLKKSEIFYEVAYCDDGKTGPTVTEEVKEKDLGYGMRCPVTIKQSETEDTMEGEIVMCTTDQNNNVVYTAMIYVGKSQVKFESDIDAERVKYRKVETDDAQSNKDSDPDTNAITTSTDGGKEKALKMHVTPPSQKPMSERFVPSSITCKDSASKRGINESINSAGSSSKKKPRYNDIKREAGDGNPTPPDPDPRSHINFKSPPHSKSPNMQRLQIAVPKWLQRDRTSQRNLFFFLLGKTNDRRRGQNMLRIYQETNCKVHIDMDDNHFTPMKIYLEPQNSNTVQQDLNRARQMIQDLFLDYVGNDACRGRLICEIAQSCWGPHRPTSSTSKAVRDINFLVDTRPVCFMSIVEISYEYDERTKEKSFHAAHILFKDFLRDISRVPCDIILVAKGFKQSTNWCDPYVLVFGRRYTDVDEGVRMVQQKIRDHQKVCGKCILNA